MLDNVILKFSISKVQDFGKCHLSPMHTSMAMDEDSDHYTGFPQALEIMENLEITKKKLHVI